MIDRDTHSYLQDVIRRTGRSFLQYAGESCPWNTLLDGAKAEEVQQMVHEEKESAAALSRFLAKNRLTPPYLGAYPSYFTSYNYLSLDRLLPMLVAHQERGITDLETDLNGLQDGETRKQIEVILAMKKRHLQAMQALAKTP